MGVYSNSYYGITKYGDTRSIDYNINFKALAVDYRTVKYQWDSFTISSPDKIYAYKIVKTLGGVPEYPNQMQIVYSWIDSTVSGATSVLPYSGVDVDNYFKSGSVVTYSFWALTGVSTSSLNWKLLGSDDAVIVDNEDDDTTLRILRLLPGAWTNQAYESLGEPDTNTDLYKFVSAFGFYYDTLRVKASYINNSSDYRKYPKELLPSSVTSLGFTYEPKLGDSFHRSMHRSGNLINALKGTYLGLSNYIRALTHLNAEVTLGSNLLLDYLNASFEGSTGFWTAQNGTFTSVARTTFDPGLPVITYNTSTKNSYYGRLVRGGVTTSSITSYTDVSKITTQGVLVSPSIPYVFSGWAKLKTGSTNTITVTATITWYDSVGNALSSVSGAAKTLADSEWRKFTSSVDFTSMKAPVDAMYAGITLSLANMSSSSDEVYFDNFSFSNPPGILGNSNFGFGDTLYEDAKNINIFLDATRTNLINNPGFEDNVGFWFGWNSRLLSTTPPIPPLMLGSTVACRASATGAGAVTIYSNWIRNLMPGKEYTFSIYVLSPTPGKTATAKIIWDMPQSIEDQVKVNSRTISGKTYFYRPTVTTKKVSSNPFVISSTSWTRISVTATAPEYTAFNGLPSASVAINFNADAANETWYLDCALFEKSPIVNTYFQGNGGIVPSFSKPTGSDIPSIISEDFIPLNDTSWESKERINLLYNPTFETTDYWYIPSSITFDPNYWSSNFESVTPTAPNTAKSGNPTDKVGRLYSDLIGGALVATNFRFPTTITSSTSVSAFPTGGETITGSVYLANLDSNPVDVFLSLNNYSSYITLPAATSPITWYRASVRGILDKPTDNYPGHTFNILAVPTGSSTVNVYLDSAQVEFGDYPTPYFVSTTAVPNLNVSTNITKTITNVQKPVLYTDNLEYATTTLLRAAFEVENTTITRETGSGLQFSPSASAYFTPTASTVTKITSKNLTPIGPNRSYSAWGHFKFASGAGVSDLKTTISWYKTDGTTLISSDDGPTFTVYANASYNTTGTATAGTNTITISGTSVNMFVGQGIARSGIPANTYITAKSVGASNTTFTLSNNLTSNISSGAAVYPWTVAMLTATSPAEAAYMQVSFSFTNGTTAFRGHLDNIVIRDNSQSIYTTSTPHTFMIGDKVTTTGITPSGFNRTDYIANINDSTSFTLDDGTAIGLYIWSTPSFSSAQAVVAAGAPQYSTASIMQNVGRSYYIPNSDLKYNRLLSTVSEYLPIGSTYTLTRGLKSNPKNEYIYSKVPSYSFENNLYGWEAYTGNTITRQVLLSDDPYSDIVPFSSASYLNIANTAGSGLFGATTSFPVDPKTKYYFSANLYAPTGDPSTLPTRNGIANLKVNWYTDSTMSTEVTTENGSPVPNDIYLETANNNNAENTWAVLTGSLTAPSTAKYAKLSILYTPQTFSTSSFENIIYIDDVICVPY